MNYALIIVTFNRLSLLKKTIESISFLTERPAVVVVVNNGSSDATNDYLQQISQEFSLPIKIISQSQNTGGSGGFNVGLAEALKSNAEWFLLIDDDVTLIPDAISSYAKYSQLSKCIHGSKKLIDGSRFNWEGYFDIRFFWLNWFYDRSFKHKDYTFVNYACFEGMMVHRDILNTIGLPDKRFFICHDDHVFGLLASLYTNVLYFKDYTLQKTLKISAPNRRSPQPYYNLRNLFLVRSYCKQYFSEYNPYFSFFIITSLFIKRSAVAILQLNFYRLNILGKAYLHGFLGKYEKLES